MSLVRAFKVLAKDFRMGPRSPIFLYAFVLPVALTFLINGVFGSLFEPTPRLGVVDQGHSQIAREVKKLDGIRVTLVDSSQRLKDMVRDNDLDAGLVLQPDFDRAVKAGSRPRLNFYIGGESLASNRIILAVTTIDLIRDLAETPETVKVEVKPTSTKEVVPIASRLLPVIIFYAVTIAGLFLPASSLVEEKENRTLSALLVTPVQIPDVILAKGALGFILSILIGIVTLAINGAFGVNPGALILGLALAALMMVELGLIVGSLAKDANVLFTIIKGSGIFLFAPAIFFIWPDLPQWIAKIFPTYYFIGPLYEIAINGAALADVAPTIAVGFGICAALVPVVWAMSGKLKANLAST